MVIEAAGGAEVVGEDLGCLPEYVRPHLESLGIAGFRIPHWDFDDEGHVVPPAELPECSFATYATHDHDTLAGLWNSYRADISNPESDTEEVRKGEFNLKLLAEFAGIPAMAGNWPVYSDVHQWRLIKSLLSSQSRYAALLITDLTGMTDRFNLPGTVGGENWRLRLPWAPSGPLANREFDAASDKLAMLISLTKRS
jgi:4-alpha-glucanotransferase